MTVHASTPCACGHLRGEHPVAGCKRFTPAPKCWLSGRPSLCPEKVRKRQDDCRTCLRWWRDLGKRSQRKTMEVPR